MMLADLRNWANGLSVEGVGSLITQAENPSG
jgi:hypothetical protein